MRRSVVLATAAVLWAALGVCDVEAAKPSGPMPLWPGVPPYAAEGDDFRPYLEPFLLDGEAVHGAVIVCPGGGYGGRADHEGAPIAAAINAAGVHAFVLQYRVAPHRHPAPLLDAARAVRIVRAHAGAWNVDPERIAILGFSAGGHLAGSLAVHHEDADSGVDDAVAQTSPAPNAAILCYAVLSSGAYGHRGSFRNLLGPKPSAGQLAYASLEQHVSKDTPPTFLWHTADDGGVPVQNALLFAEALAQHGVPFELHVYPHGRHGLGLAQDDPHVATWMDLCCQWLKGQGY